MKACTSPKAVFDQVYIPPSPGGRELSSSTVSAEGTKKVSSPSTHSVRPEGPTWAATASQRNEMIAATLRSTMSKVPRTRCKPAIGAAAVRGGGDSCLLKSVSLDRSAVLCCSDQ